MCSERDEASDEFSDPPPEKRPQPDDWERGLMIRGVGCLVIQIVVIVILWTFNL